MAKRGVDRSTISGILVAAVGVAVGLFLDGGNVRQIVQPTAALIVFGGTLGAVMVQFPMRTLREAVSRLQHVFLEPEPPSPAFVEELLAYAGKARRRGVVSLDSELSAIEHPFLRKCLTFAVDGLKSAELRDRMELDLVSEEERDEAVASVFEAAGGFAPTVGILGAVLGLIQVMQRLDHIGEVGKGIAVAFVATLYGVGSANLLLLPLAGKMRLRAREQQLTRELMLEASIAIADGVSLGTLRQRLNGYLEEVSVTKVPIEAAAR